MGEPGVVITLAGFLVQSVRFGRDILGRHMV